MNFDKERERLSQAETLKDLKRPLRLTDMVTVYQIETEGPNSLYQERYIYSALIPAAQIEEALSDSEWDLGLGDGMPVSGGGKYLRYGTENGVEPLVIYNDRYHAQEAWPEICEEFRHFHGLYHDREKERYLKIDEDLEEVVVATVEPKHVQIRLQEILEWLALKEMYLSIQFRCWERSERSPEELGLNPTDLGQEKSDTWDMLHREDLVCWRHSYKDVRGIQNYQVDSRLVGKHLIEPLPKSESGCVGFSPPPKRRYVQFIVNVHGDEYTCDPEKLNDFSGENPDAPSYLTPIHFSKQVLDRYYHEPNKYTVKDSSVGTSWWSMTIDNHAPDKVCVMFRDLCHLPYTEQLHWRVHNILPEGGVSETFSRRNVQGEWASSDQPDLLFKQHYERLQRACDECLGWQLLKPLGSGDAYHLKRIRVPAVDEESDFKDLVSDLTSVLIDKSLNEKRLKDLIPVIQRKEVKRGINLLESVLTSRSIDGSERHIRFLRSLWDLRTTRSSAHPEMRDDKRYERAAKHFNLDNLNCSAAFAKILEQAVAFLEFLTDVVRSGKLGDKNGDGC